MPVQKQPPSGKKLSEYLLHDGGYTAVTTESGHLIRFFGTFEFRVSNDLTSIEVVRDPSADPGVGEILLAGAVLAIYLGLKSVTTLHASSVAFGNEAVALVAGSGGGKSTIAAELCCEGGLLVTDDLLRLQDFNRCYLGTDQLRVRREAVERVFHSLSGEPTADGRISFSFPTPDARPALTALVSPILSKEATKVTVGLLKGAEGLLEAVRFPRIAGWCYPAALLRQFRYLAALARRVPVYRAVIPWGIEQPRTSTGTDLLDLLNAEGLLQKSAKVEAVV